MNKLKQLLQAKKVNWSDEQLQKYLQDKGISPDKITDAQSIKIADEIIKGTSMVKVGGNPAPIAAIPPETLEQLGNNIGGQLQNLVEEIDTESKVAAIAAGERMFESISGIPAGALQHCLNLAEEVQDPQTFRGVGKALVRAIAPTFVGS